jgi:hypothetical protein
MQHVLQFLNAQRDRRLGDAQLRGRTAEIPGIADGDQRAQQICIEVDVHEQPPPQLVIKRRQPIKTYGTSKVRALALAAAQANACASSVRDKISFL